MRCNIVGLLGLKLAGHGSRQNNTITNAFNFYGRIRYKLCNGIGNVLQSSAGRRPVDFDVIAGHLIAVAIEKDDVGGPFVDCNDVSTSRRADHGIGYLRFSNQHILDVSWKIDDDRFADAEPNHAR